jgi:hypothetical protein
MKLSHPEDFNIDLAEKVLGLIKIHPEVYNQNHHDRCLIGWAGRLEAKERGASRWQRFDGGDALGLTGRERSHIFNMMSPPWAKRRLRNFIRQAQSYRAEQEELRQRLADEQARQQVEESDELYHDLGQQGRTVDGAGGQSSKPSWSLRESMGRLLYAHPRRVGREAGSHQKG